jgi:hypothetical protein
MPAMKGGAASCAGPGASSMARLVAMHTPVPCVRSSAVRQQPSPPRLPWRPGPAAAGGPAAVGVACTLLQLQQAALLPTPPPRPTALARPKLSPDCLLRGEQQTAPFYPWPAGRWALAPQWLVLQLRSSLARPDTGWLARLDASPAPALRVHAFVLFFVQCCQALGVAVCPGGHRVCIPPL